MAEDGKTTQRLKGRVKWFNPAKGFGFIVPEDGGRDILIHVNVLRDCGLSELSENAQIEFSAEKSERGLQAVEVHAVETPRDGAGAGGERDARGAKAKRAEAAELQPARIKWFNAEKGFGFVRVFGVDEDVFIHMDTLRRAGMSYPEQGEGVAVRIAEGKRGRMVSEVEAWDSACR